MGAWTQHLFACAAYDSYDKLLSPAPVAAIGPALLPTHECTQRQHLYIKISMATALHTFGRLSSANTDAQRASFPVPTP